MQMLQQRHRTTRPRQASVTGLYTPIYIFFHFTMKRLGQFSPHGHMADSWRRQFQIYGAPRGPIRSRVQSLKSVIEILALRVVARESFAVCTIPKQNGMISRHIVLPVYFLHKKNATKKRVVQFRCTKRCHILFQVDFFFTEGVCVMEEMRSNGRTGTYSVPQPEKPLDSPMFGFIFFKKKTPTVKAHALL